MTSHGVLLGLCQRAFRRKSQKTQATAVNGGLRGRLFWQLLQVQPSTTRFFLKTASYAAYSQKLEAQLHLLPNFFRHFRSRVISQQVAQYCIL